VEGVRVRRTIAALVLAALALPGCGVAGLSFVQDKRLTFVAPEDRAEVTLPFTVDWEMADFAITGPDGSSAEDAGYFGVFVDRDPQPPGEPLGWIARDDGSCLHQAGCPDQEYLARRRVYSTSETSLTIQVLPDTELLEGRREFHEVVVILLDGTGRRIGESAWFVEFQVRREGD
jgi:hypothetical protein